MAPIWFSISCLWREVTVGDGHAWLSAGKLESSTLQVRLWGDRSVCGRKLEGGGILANKGEIKGVKPGQQVHGRAERLWWQCLASRLWLVRSGMVVGREPRRLEALGCVRPPATLWLAAPN